MVQPRNPKGVEMHDSKSYAWFGVIAFFTGVAFLLAAQGSSLGLDSSFMLGCVLLVFFGVIGFAFRFDWTHGRDMTVPTVFGLCSTLLGIISIVLWVRDPAHLATYQKQEMLVFQAIFPMMIGAALFFAEKQVMRAK